MSDTNCRFVITKEKFGTYSLYRLQDNKTGEYVTILPEFGGSVNSLVLKQNEELLNIIDGYHSVEDITKNLITSFKGSNLYPFPNRIEGGKYAFKGHTYHLICNFPQENNAIHGLVYDKVFELISKEDGDFACNLILRHITTETISGYPFENMIEIHYKWDEQNQFECTTKITNLSDGSMPVGQGWHPYYTAGNVSVDELYIQFPSKEILDLNEKGIPTGKKSLYKNFNSLSQLGKTNFDSCFVLDSESENAEITIENRKENITYKIWQQTGINKYNYLQVYTPPSRTSIAIEPMTCAPNAFNTGDGLIVLAPQERISFVWGIKRTV
jgi:aldose 1-epimerase